MFALNGYITERVLLLPLRKKKNELNLQIDKDFFGQPPLNSLYAMPKMAAIYSQFTVP